MNLNELAVITRQNQIDQVRYGGLLTLVDSCPVCWPE